jgi:hypothetical protein
MSEQLSYLNRQPEPGGDRERMEEDVVGLKLKHPVAHRFGELGIEREEDAQRLSLPAFRLLTVAWAFAARAGGFANGRAQDRRNRGIHGRRNDRDVINHAFHYMARSY